MYSNHMYNATNEHEQMFRTKMHIDLFLPVSCVIKWKVMLPLYNDQISLLTVLAVIHRFSLKRPPVYNDGGNFISQVVGIHRFDCFWKYQTLHTPVF